jgi:hypothetical protein
MNIPKAPIITPVERIMVNLDELSLPVSQFTNNMSEIATVVENIVTSVVANEESPRLNTLAQINESYGTFLTLDKDIENKCCPTCGVHSAWHTADYSHRICVPSIGPAKPDRLQDVFGSVTGRNLHFRLEDMTEEERVATGGNFFRCQTVANGNCALCMEWCQEQGPSQWEQFTGWDWCHSHCWMDLCWRYHVEYLQPNGYVNTLARFLLFLED